MRLEFRKPLLWTSRLEEAQEKGAKRETKVRRRKRLKVKMVA